MVIESPHLCIYSFDQYLRLTICMPGSILDMGISWYTKKIRVFVFRELVFYCGKQGDNEVNK